MRTAAENGIKNVIQDYHVNQTDAAANKVLDDIQSHLKCCGAHNASDWKQNEEFKDNDKYPYSCCDQTPDNKIQFCSPTNAYKQGMSLILSMFA